MEDDFTFSLSPAEPKASPLNTATDANAEVPGCSRQESESESENEEIRNGRENLEITGEFSSMYRQLSPLLE